MDEYESLSHSKWECKYHHVFIPKCGRKCCTRALGSIWVKCSSNWRGAREAGWNKGIFQQTMCT